jgi:hypothetical protein
MSQNIGEGWQVVACYSCYSVPTTAIPVVRAFTGFAEAVAFISTLNQQDLVSVHLRHGLVDFAVNLIPTGVQNG